MRGVALLLCFCTAGALADPGAGFVGSWAGQWKEGTKTGPRGTMTISATAEGKLLVVYSFDTPKRRTLSSADRVYGQGVAALAEDGSLHVTLSNGARVVCRLRDENSLVGEYDRDEMHYDGRFERVEKR